MKRMSFILAIVGIIFGLTTVASPSASAEEYQPSNVWATWSRDYGSVSYHYDPAPDGSYGSAVCTVNECSKVVRRYNPTRERNEVFLKRKAGETFAYGSYTYQHARTGTTIYASWSGSPIAMTTKMIVPETGRVVTGRLVHASISLYSPAFPAVDAGPK